MKDGIIVGFMMGILAMLPIIIILKLFPEEIGLVLILHIIVSCLCFLGILLSFRTIKD